MPTNINNKLLDDYLYYLRNIICVSNNTISAYKSDSLKFFIYLDNKSILSVNKQIISAYLNDRKIITTATHARIMSSLANFFQYLVQQNKIAENPLKGLKRPKNERLLLEYLSEQEVDALLKAPDNNTNIGIRDRAMFELLYSCGLRVSELVNLSFRQVDILQQNVLIFGKGNKERLLPIGLNSLKFIENYFYIRKKQNTTNKSPFFLSNRGFAMSRQNFWYIVKNYTKQIGCTKKISPHSIRHAFATHLVQRGADLRSVQLFLGHNDISTTQIYTHIHNQRLKKQHQKHHPKG